MPTSSLRPAVVGRYLPGTSFQTPHSFRPADVLISLLSECACGEDMTGMGATNALSGTYPGANLGLAFPFEIAEPILVQKVWWVNGTTATTDRADVSVHTEAGVRLVAGTTSPTIATANIVQESDCTDTLIPPGRYWCAYAQSGVTATPMAFATPAALMRAMGCAQMTALMVSNANGATFTPAAITGAVFPWFGIAARTQVA